MKAGPAPFRCLYQHSDRMMPIHPRLAAPKQVDGQGISRLVLELTPWITQAPGRADALEAPPFGPARSSWRWNTVPLNAKNQASCNVIEPKRVYQMRFTERVVAHRLRRALIPPVGPPASIG